jgi:cytochrome oxidase Cu insertion factor (SCO1/SenC/PrrC family)
VKRSREVKRHRRTARRIWILIGIEVVICLSLVLVIVRIRSDRGAETPSPRASGIPATISTQLAGQMGLAPLSGLRAKDFTLQDQRGKPVSLEALRGRVVVLQFMDPHCTDICPIASQEVVNAYRDLGPVKRQVEFVTVNVNRFSASTADVMSFTSEHGLDVVPTWHFVTGPPAKLADVWRNYGVEVEASSPTADVMHSTQVYFIDPNGRIRYVAMTTVEYTSQGVAYMPVASLRAWGHGIAAIAESLVHR